MPDNTDTVLTDDDIADVSLVDTPIAPPEADTPSQTEDETPTEGTETQDKSTESTDKTDAKDSEATGQDDQNVEQPNEDQTQPDPKEVAKRAYQDRQKTRQQIAQQIDQNYGPKTEEDLIEEGLAPRDAQIEALRQEIAFKDQRTAIAEMNAGMQSDAVNVLSDFSVFNPESPDYDEEFTAEVQAQYVQASRLQTDEQGIVLNAELPLYDFYQRAATIYNRGASKGSEKGQTDTLQMLSRTENPGSANPGTNTGNDLSDLEERLGDVVIT